MVFIFVVSSFLTAGTSLLLGFFALLSKSKVSKIWFLAALSIAIWSFSLGMEVSSPNYNTALFWNKILNIGAIFIPIFFYNFIISFLETNNKEKKILIVGYILSLFFIFSNFSTTLFVKGVPPKAGFNYWVEVGPIYYFFFLYFIFYILRSFYLLLIFKKESEKIKKAQINYLLIAIIFGAGGGITNFFPQIFNIYPVGNYLVALYVIFITYAVLRHHLFDIKIIATELFVFAIFVTLLIKILLSKDIQDLITNIIIFSLITFFATLLVRSIIKEVKQREKIEELAMRVQQAYEVEKQAHAAETRNRERAEELAKDAQRLDSAKTQFIMATQHHLRTPLTAMMGYLDLLMTGSYGKIPNKINDILQKLEKSTKNEIKIVNDLLDVSQFQLGKKVAFLQKDIDIEVIIKDIMEDVKFEADSKKLFLEFEKPIKLPLMKADPEKLKVALTNLLDNAIKYTSQGGVKIKCEAADSKVRIIIKDTGLGLAPEEIIGLFNRVFERSKEAQRTFATGRGIGLYITSQIIKEHGGKVWAESEGKGKGSTFFVELPV